jgi:hypothetical protein
LVLSAATATRMPSISRRRRDFDRTTDRREQARGHRSGGRDSDTERLFGRVVRGQFSLTLRWLDRALAPIDSEVLV